ncbi:hypothetical protein JKP88DRAFT_235790 [Tribonema minus]|uniref:Uncharacterized protein n=1 Tax=Tribonema minus TaxID=303371 RepID=A0A835Z5F0_9STRA|nr:hypothetical protein JKP88DRAFT_235790 [Tribonema minus]
MACGPCAVFVSSVYFFILKLFQTFCLFLSACRALPRRARSCPCPARPPWPADCALFLSLFKICLLLIGVFIWIL